MNAHYNPAGRAGVAPAERSAYRRSRGADPLATIGAIAVGAATISAFSFMHPTFASKEARPPIVVRLMELPDDPPPEPEPPPPQAHAPPPVPQVTAPPPLVTLVERPVIQAPPPVPAPVTPPAPPRPAAPPAARGPENMGELSARMIAARPPRYPMESRRAREEGTVVLSVLLSADGRVTEIAIARSSGFTRLDRAALDAVRGWRWSPMMRDGAPVMVRGIVTIPFVLQHGGRPDERRAGGHHGRGPDDRGPGDRRGSGRDGNERPLSDGDTI